MTTYTLYSRSKVEVNTDPQRRCYNGCHAKSELHWSKWEVLNYSLPEFRKESSIAVRRELNDYAISQRGEAARSEFKVELNKETENVV